MAILAWIVVIAIIIGILVVFGPTILAAGGILLGLILVGAAIVGVICLLAWLGNTLLGCLWLTNTLIILC